MAANMTRLLQPGKFHLFLLALLCLPAGSVNALPDPTRPAVGAGVEDGLVAASHEGRVRGLRSVIVSAQRCAAVIDGKTVLLGEPYGREKLVEVGRDHVVLQGATGNRVMNLYPAVGMKVVKNSENKAQQQVCKIGDGHRSMHEVDDVKEKK